MDKNKIKSFAIWARRKMIESVTEKAERIGIKKDKIEEVEVIQGGFKLGEEIFYLPNKHREALKHQIKIKGFEEVMEEAAYTWFNRFMGLRYMEVNDYLPSGIRILSSSDKERSEPDVLRKVSEVIDELGLNADEIYDLLDTGNTADREKAYRIILVKQCNELGKIIPQMFEKISDYTELLLPDNLLEEGSVIRKMVEDIEESDWKEEVEIIGWMYQYYNTENNELVYDGNMKRSRIPKELLPAATQIFTPDWVVRYLVENSLGKLLIEIKDKKELKQGWEFYVDYASENSTIERNNHINLEDIKLLDPCMGSGHILVYAFDVLFSAYEEFGYSQRDIPKLILKNNLYGLDIDDRASQLAAFALIMKARQYNRRLFREIEREQIQLNLCSIQESNGIEKDVIEFFVKDDIGLRNELYYLLETFKYAKEYGSIISIDELSYSRIENRIEEIKKIDNFIFNDYIEVILNKIPQFIKQAKIISKKYNVVVTNPPYLNSSRMSNVLLNFVNKKYPDSKSDFSMIFLEKVISDYCSDNGFIAFVTTNSWMFLKSFEKIRKNIVKNLEFQSLVDFGTELFDGKVGHNPIVAWVNKKCRPQKNMCAIRLTEYCYSRRGEKRSEFFNEKNRFYLNQNKLLKIPGVRMAYWLSDTILNSYENEVSFGEVGISSEGVKTGDNEKYLRYWYEVNGKKFSFAQDRHGCKWYPHHKGGEYRKWYGNLVWAINWENDGMEIKNSSNSGLQGSSMYFDEVICWSKITSKGISMRYIPKNCLFDSASPAYKTGDKLLYCLGFVNSCIGDFLVKSLNPTLSCQVGDIKTLPLIYKNEFSNAIDSVVRENIAVSKREWDSFETSWDFKVHPLLKSLYKGQQYKLSSIFNIWQTECEENFYKLKSNEEELNRIFIDIYGLQDELTPEEDDKDVTIRKADRERDIKSLISYAVGCMFGRYSIDAEGLIYAGGEFNDKWAVDSEQCKVRNIEKDDDGNVISDSWVNATFIPDEDNIIPITEDEYFEDDIVSRFITFIRTVYGEENLEENLDYIADSIGRKTSESARQAIRRYFIKDFYKDHLKIYQKRPIYWMFDSGKNNGFKCLIYMHRYNEQTIAKVRTDYLHTLQRKYESEINRQQLIIDANDSSTKDKTVAKKKIDKINKQIEECREYDEVVAYLANEKISIDLDDGVKVNYAKFQNVSIINSKNKEVKMNLLAKI